MKLYVFSAPYDYHRMAELVVLAETESEAQTIAEKAKKERLQEDYAWDRYFWQELVVSSIKPLDTQWYINNGCDC